ncbi:MAG: hypothetical protein KTR31_16760 [Myxococcales bacterium]|nr:hypothetical protein [Myxococcales bacterium]
MIWAVLLTMASGCNPCESDGTICTWLGVPGEALFDEDGLHRLDSHSYLPQDIDFGPDGTAYFPDFNNHRVRRVTTKGIVDTISGTGTLGDGPIGSDGCWEPCNTMASAWNHPTQVAVHPQRPNEVWVAAWHNSRINVIDTEAETLTWYAGTGARFFGEADTLEEAILDLPSSLAFAPDGTLYFSDQANHIIRRISGGQLETIAGQPRQPGFAGDGGPAIDASLHGHTDQKADPGSKLALDGDLLYVADTVNGVIRVVDLAEGTIDTFAGAYTSAGTETVVDAVTEKKTVVDAGSVAGYAGDGGPAIDAVFNTPRDVAVGIDGELYVADTKNHCVRVIADGQIDTFAGVCGESGFSGDEGPATAALLNEPFGVGVDPDGNVYIADTLNQVIRRVRR